MIKYVFAQYSVVFYTVAFGNQYTNLAKSWCYQIEHKLVSKIVNSTSFILTDTEKIKYCNVIKSYVEKDPEYEIKIKLLKMTNLQAYSVFSKLYMWLDVDIRPYDVKWFTRFINNCQKNELINNKTIGLTKTRKKTKYNGGLFIYSDFYCIEKWKKLITNGMNMTQRDQPALKYLIDSSDCSSFDLPENTQKFFMMKGLYKNYSFIHFTGNNHKYSKYA